MLSIANRDFFKEIDACASADSSITLVILMETGEISSALDAANRKLSRATRSLMKFLAVVLITKICETSNTTLV